MAEYISVSRAVRTYQAPVPHSNATPNRRSPQGMREEVTKQDLGKKRQAKKDGCSGLVNQTKCTYQRNRTPQGGEMRRSSPPPPLSSLSFPRTVPLSGLRRKCHRFQEYLSSATVTPNVASCCCCSHPGVSGLN